MGDEVRTEENFFRWTITINSFTGRSPSSPISLAGLAEYYVNCHPISFQ